MNSLFHATFSWLSAVVVSFKNSLIFTQDVTDSSVNTCCKLKLVFLESVFSLSKVFADDLDKKEAFIKTVRTTTVYEQRKMRIFPKGLVHRFGQKFEISSILNFIQNRPRKSI